MKQKPLFIAFSTRKGGVGKSTFTVLAATGYTAGQAENQPPDTPRVQNERKNTVHSVRR
jgi:Mrp family chromosome partitioning ATPase